MENESYALHQLPLVNFNGHNNNAFAVSDEIKKQSHHEDTYKNSKEKQTCKTNTLLGKCPKYTKTKNTSPIFFKKRLRSPLKATNCASKRLIFGNTSKSFVDINNIQRSSNLRDIKQKYSLYGVISDHIKQKVSKLLNFKADKKNKQKKVDNTKRTLKGNNRVDSIKVLFEAKNPKNRKRTRNRNVSRDYRRLDLFYNSKSSCDVNGHRYNRQCAPTFCYQLLKCKSNSFLQSHKFRVESYEHDFCRKTETNSKNIKRYNFSPACDCNTPVHYKLIDFPCNNIYKCLDLKRSLSRKCNCKSPVVIQQPRINRGVRVTSSCFNCKSGAGDAAECLHNSKVKVTISNYNIKAKTDSCINNKLKCKRRKPLCKPKLSAHAIYFRNNYFISLLKSTLKVFLLIFAIIAWSPCIVTVCVYWLITYPLRPQHIFTQAKVNACECGSCFKYGNEFWHIIFHSIVRALEKVGHAYNALCSSIKNQKPENTDILNPCLPQSSVMKRNSIRKHRKLQMYANPKKRYTLYYTRHRGWIMKPTRKHRKRKRNLLTSIPKDGNVQRRCRLNSSKRYPGICQIGVQGTSTSIKNTPYIKISKKRHVDGNRKRNLTTYLSKMVSTRSSPLLLDKSSLMNVRPIFNRCFKSVCNTSIPFKVENEIYKQNDLGTPCFGGSFTGNIKTNTYMDNKQTRKSRFGNLQYNTQISSQLNGNFTGKKYLEYFPCKYQYMGRCHSKQRNYWAPSGSFSSRILLQKTRYPYSKISVVKPSPQKLRKKIRIITVPRDNQRRYKCYKCENKNLTLRQKVFNYCKTALKRFRCLVHTTETETWTSDICNEMYISTLRNKPWYWVYKACPSFYPYFLIFCKFNQNVVQCLLLMFSTCFWCPIICCCYFCYSLFWKCVC